MMLLVSMFMLRAQNGFWEEAKGPYGGFLFEYTKTSTGRLYAIAGPSQTYRSDENGLSWERLPALGESFPDSLD